MKRQSSQQTQFPDRGEHTSSMEPLLLPSDCGDRTDLHEMAFDLAVKSTALKSGLPSSIVSSMADLLRITNCYYSNLIEGHDTHPYDIERAQKKDYSSDARKRNLQLEAEAHIAVQKFIDDGGLDARATTAEAITETHRRFCELLPAEMRVVVDPVSREKGDLVPGQFRMRDVKVGHLIAISPGAIPRFLMRFHEAYGPLPRNETIVAAAAAHHRLLWIHPFLDGNGRVARLMSYAQLREAAGTGGLWSIARGLARNVNEYKRHLMECDEQRQFATDGRGPLSQRALVEFTRFFLKTCLDQADYMSRLIQPTELRRSILSWVDEERKKEQLLPGAPKVLEAILYRGELPRGELPDLLGVSDRQARRVVSGLISKGVLTAAHDKAPLRLAFPAHLANRWLPGLFPDS